MAIEAAIPRHFEYIERNSAWINVVQSIAFCWRKKIMNFSVFMKLIGIDTDRLDIKQKVKPNKKCVVCFCITTTTTVEDKKIVLLVSFDISIYFN